MENKLKSTATDKPSDDATQLLRDELLLKQEEFQQRKAEHLDAKRWNPLTVTLAAATLAGFANALALFINGYIGQELEVQKADHSRIQEMLRTGNPDTAAANLSFLLEIGLIRDAKVANKIELALKNRVKGTGPALFANGTYQDPSAYSYNNSSYSNPNIDYVNAECSFKTKPEAK